MNEVYYWFQEHIQAVIWTFTAIALLGSYFNATTRFKLSYVLWLGSNFFFVWHNFRIGEVQQCVLYLVYLYTAILGLKNTYHQKGWFERSSL
ncbi:MAG: hypothetical protein LW808_001020 [Verrucomicrobiota bacterium]|nr:MAG: hypothetical protein LW808_001020 [Verrucomicrobiota bacterium]